MPELPEVETVRRGLAKALTGDKVVAVEVLRTDSIALVSATQFAKRMKGREFAGVQRRGKYLLLDLDGEMGMACHLRMSGRLIVKSPLADGGIGAFEDNKFLRVRFELKSGRQLHFEDMRVFGRLWFKSGDQSFDDIIPALLRLGPEPLGDFNGKMLGPLLQGKKQAIKTALLDQTLVAGVGNIYADESLFLAAIHPQRAAGSLSAKELDRLAQHISAVLERAIASGGSTLRDYTNAEGVNGNYQNEAYVYGRAGGACRECGGEISRIKLGGRGTHFCPRCQKMGRR